MKLKKKLKELGPVETLIVGCYITIIIVLINLGFIFYKLHILNLKLGEGLLF